MSILGLSSEENIKLVKEVFNLDDISFLLYIGIFAFYILLYKVIKNALDNISNTKKTNVELTINHYTEIENSADTISQNSNEEQHFSFMTILRNSYNYIELPVYKKIKEILNRQNPEDVLKVNEIQQIVSIRNKELIEEKNRLLDYSFKILPTHAIKIFVDEFRNIVSSIFIAFFVLFLIFSLLLLTIIQPNYLERVITITASLLLPLVIFILIDDFKRLKENIWILGPFLLCIALILGAILTNGVLLYTISSLFILLIILMIIRTWWKERNS